MKVSQCEVFTVLYSLREKKYIESKKVALKDSRKRDLYILLPEGKVYYEKALEDYKENMNSVNQVLTNISFFIFINYDLIFCGVNTTVFIETIIKQSILLMYSE